MSEAAKLTTDDVRAIADLARLDLTDAEVARYAAQLSQILDYFTLLEEVDTTQVAPTASVLPLRNVMREDVDPVALAPEAVVANAPEAHENQFVVHAVLDGE
jgi:aspartyl-tRNA(Asn)/glutamyl-tRNA(Gln) amidotransferase subunit C